MNQFVRNRQMAYETPARTVFELVQRATGQKPVRRTKIVTGYENEVYQVETEPAAMFFVRIRRTGTVAFQHEAWAIERCRAVGVPVPEILLIEPIQVDGQHLQAMVQTGIPGRPLSDLLGGLEQPALPTVLHQVGEILGRMHTVQVEGFGRRHGDGTWDFTTWAESMDATLRRVDAEKAYLVQAGFSPQDLAFMLEMVHRYRNEFPCPQPVLCHGDLEPAHIFVVPDLRISGVIDFGQIQGAPPIRDFIDLSFVQPSLDLAPLKEGYPDRPMVHDRFDRRLQLERLTFLMGCVAHITRVGDEEADKTPDALGQLQRTLAALRQ